MSDEQTKKPQARNTPLSNNLTRWAKSRIGAGEAESLFAMI
jgi:hypothetical protein